MEEFFLNKIAFKKKHLKNKWSEKLVSCVILENFSTVFTKSIQKVKFVKTKED